jgi:spermidine synthase
LARSITSKRIDIPHAINCPPALFLLVLSCFFLSGTAGLIYETLWVRMIDKVIGSAPFAVATVLSVFMGGLALGSIMAGMYIDRLQSKGALLSLYGRIEVVIGVYALIFPFLITAATPLYRWAYDLLLPYFRFYQFFSFLGCLALLIIPTSLMGVTLPVLCRFYVMSLDHLGARTGRLYGLNTIGAALGSVLCGFFLVGSLGVWGTLFVAAGTNFIIGALCILAARHKAFSSPAPTAMNRTKKSGVKLSKPRAELGDDGKTVRWALWIFAVSGFCSMAYEVVWTKLLGLLIGPTTYSFTLVISTFIIGLAAGSIIFGRLGDKTQKVFLLLASTQLCASILALAVSQLLGNSQFFFAKLIHTFQHGFGTMIAVQSIVLFAVLLGPTIFLGAALPLVNRIYARSLPGLGKSIGIAYAVNTLGAILGSFAAGFILIPLVGKENGLRLVIMFQFVTSFAALTFVGFGLERKSRQRLAGIALAVSGALLIFSFPSWNRSVLARGWYRNFHEIENDLARTSWTESLWKGARLLARERGGLEVVFYGDGIGGFTTVEKETTSLGQEEYALYNSGKADASSHGDRSTQALSGHIPLLFHPNPERVMVVGLASGMTPGEALLYPVKRLDILEINDQAARACRSFFSPWNNACLDDPRTRLIIQDGRNHLALTREKYDVIISEPSNPWMAGLANLYTLDFFRLVQERLNDKGVFAQWIQSYEMDWSTFALLGRTFKEAFPNGALMKIGPADYLLLGFARQGELDWKAAKENIEYARSSTNVSFPGFGFLANMVITEDLQELFGEGPLHTDDWPRLEFSAPRQLYGGNLDLDRIIAERRRLSPETARVLEAHSDANALLDLIEFAASANTPLFTMLNPEELTPSQRERYVEIMKRFCGRTLVPSYRIFPDHESKEECAAIQIGMIRERLAVDASRADDHYNLSLSLIPAGRTEEAIDELELTATLDPLHEEALTALGLLSAESGRFDEAAGYFSRVVEIAPGNAQAYKNLGMAEARQEKGEEAVMHLNTALQLEPNDVTALNELGSVLLNQGKIEEAIGAFSKALLTAPENAEAHNNLGMALYRKGEIARAVEHLSEALRLAPDNANVRHNLRTASRLLERPRKLSTDAQPRNGPPP